MCLRECSNMNTHVGGYHYLDNNFDGYDHDNDYNNNDGRDSRRR